MTHFLRFDKLSLFAAFALALMSATPTQAQPRPLLDYRGITVPNSPTSATRTGGSLTAAGDVNGDGHDDLLVHGSVLVQNPTFYSDRLLLYLGSPAGLEPTPAWIATPLTANPSDFARTYRGVGDVNNDGYDDVMVNAYGEHTPGFSHAQTAQCLLYSYSRHCVPLPGRSARTERSTGLERRAARVPFWSQNRRSGGCQWRWIR